MTPKPASKPVAKPAAKTAAKPATPEALVRASISKYAPKDQKLFRAVRTALHKEFPTANELAYDYGHSALISFSPTEHGIDGILSVAIRADGVRVCLAHAVRLADPTKRLSGSATQVRYFTLTSASTLKEPDVKALMAATVAGSKTPLPTTGKGRLIIRTTAAARAPRRKPAK